MTRAILLVVALTAVPSVALAQSPAKPDPPAQPRPNPVAVPEKADPGPKLAPPPDNGTADKTGGANDSDEVNDTDEADEADGATSPLTGSGADKPDLITTQPPPDRWQTFSVAGELLESATITKALLAQRMAKHQALNANARAELKDFCKEELGYELLRIKKTRNSAGSLHATLILRPLIAVYKVNVDVDNLPEDWFLPYVFFPQIRTISRGFFESVFADQIQRRMRLRQGARLPRNADGQARALIRERIRIEEFLKNQGFFDARVRVTAKPRNKNTVTIEVEIRKGRRYQVGAITVVGATSLPTSGIEKRFKHGWVCIVACFLEGGFSREQLTKDVQSVVKMYRKRGYPGARVRTDFDVRHSFNRDNKTVEFTVYVTERRRVDIVFIGNDKKKAPDERLRKQLTFSAEGSYDDLEIRSSAEAIRRYYQGRGRFEANVSYDRVPFGVFERIVFTIDEGPKLPVRNVSFEGNSSVPGKTLRSLVKTRRFRDVAILGGGGGFVTTVQLDQDVARISQLYRRRGFPQIKVRARVARARNLQSNAAALAAAVAGQLSASGLYVRFIVEEGPQQRVQELRIVFEERFTILSKIRDPKEKNAKRAYFDRQQKVLMSKLRLRKGDPFHASKLRRDRTRLARYQFGRGHPHARIVAQICPKPIPPDPDASYNCPEGLDPSRLRIDWLVDEKPPVTFGKVALRGNHHTAGWVLRSELGIDDGERMTLARAERAQQNLRTTGLFRAVNVNYVDFEDDSLSRHNVVVNVLERPRHTLEIAGGYSTDKLFFGEAAYNHRNWFGVGLKPDVRAHWGQQLQSLETKLALPRWIGRKMSRGLIAFNTEAAAFVRNETTERFGDLLSTGTSLSLSKAGQYGFFRGWVGSLRYDLRARRRDVELVRPAGASEDLSSGKVLTVTGSVGPQLVIDRRTDRDGRPQPLLPEKGWQLEVHASYADPILSQPVRLVGEDPGRDRFIKLGGSGQIYWKPSRRTLVTNGVRYDHGVPLGNEFLLPEVERFFAGGDTTVRGFEEDRLATEIIEEPLPPLGSVTQLRVLPAGGNIRLLYNIDLQLQVWTLGGFPVTSAIFFDTGLVTNSLDGVRVTDLRHSVGAAMFRWSLPVGSLSLEYAVPLDPRTGDNPRGRFHFNLGLLF